MYKVTLVTILSETVGSMQQFPSSSCKPRVIFCCYSLVMLQSYVLVAFCVCVCVCACTHMLMPACMGSCVEGGGGSSFLGKKKCSTWEENISRTDICNITTKILNHSSHTVHSSEKTEDKKEHCRWCSGLQGKIVLTVSSVGSDSCVQRLMDTLLKNDIVNE
jgi:hypothetical protein